MLGKEDNQNIREELRLGDPKSQARKPKTKAQAWGQVWTSSAIAKQMAQNLLLSNVIEGSKLLDPCVGPATFLKAIYDSRKAVKVIIDAFDIDEEMINKTAEWCKEKPLEVNICHCDYLEQSIKDKYDYAILNPPYVRQEWIEKKTHYISLFKEKYGITIPGTSNLYVYFILKVLEDLKAGGRFSCIVYDSWQSTRYGKWLQEYIMNVCENFQIESIHNLPFEGRLIDATIICGAKAGNEVLNIGKKNHISMSSNDFTSRISCVKEIDELFTTERGLRLKQAGFFMTHIRNADSQGAMPFVKKIALIPGYIVPDDHPEAVLLLTSKNENKKTLNELNSRIMIAQANPERNIPILTWNTERPETWTYHDRAPRAPIIYNYYIRHRPKFIYNPLRIYSDNFYGLIPKNNVSALAWLVALNCTISIIGLFEKSRNQGAGLAKLQLFEFRKSKVLNISNWSTADQLCLETIGKNLISGASPEIEINKADELVAKVTGDKLLDPQNLYEKYYEADKHARQPKY